MMVPETRQRLESALADLTAFVVRAQLRWCSCMHAFVPAETLRHRCCCLLQSENAQDAADSEELAAAREAVASVEGMFT